MPIRVQDELPAVNFLRNENVFVMTTTRATTQEIRPLKVLILNLMPKKIETENQFLRLLSNSPLQVDIQLLRIDARESRNTPAEHLNNFYCNFDEICDQNFDGLIVTGAPLGLVEFNDVAYWPQIKQVLEWAKDHVTSTLFVDPDVRGCGVGKLLIEHALSLTPKLTTNVNEQNEQAVGFYQKMGFRVTGRSETDDLGQPYPLLNLMYEQQAEADYD